MYKIALLILAGLTLADQATVEEPEELDELEVIEELEELEELEEDLIQTEAEKVPEFIPCEESKVESKFCWNDDHLAKHFIHKIDSAFYSKYIQNPEKEDLEDGLTNPEGPWLIVFLKNYAGFELPHAVEMVTMHRILMDLNQGMKGSINIGYLDIHTPEGELMKHTFDVQMVPAIFRVSDGFYKQLPQTTELNSIVIKNFMQDMHHELDRQPLRPAVMRAGILLEYVNQFIADKYFGRLLSTVLAGNKLMGENTGFKIDFKEGYEHFGKKNKYRAQQVRHLAHKLMWPLLIAVSVVVTTLFCILFAIISCICKKQPVKQKKH